MVKNLPIQDYETDANTKSDGTSNHSRYTCPLDSQNPNALEVIEMLLVTSFSHTCSAPCPVEATYCTIRAENHS
jgi:hypothetical protein